MREKKALFNPMSHRLKEGALIISLVFAILLLLGLFTYTQTDASGKLGIFFAHRLFYLFGFTAYLLPFVIPFGVWLAFQKNHPETAITVDDLPWRVLGLILTLISVCGLGALEFSGGGIVGTAIALISYTALNQMGAIILLFGLLLCGVTLLTGISWLALSSIVGKSTLNMLVYMLEWFEEWREEFLLKKCKQDDKELKNIKLSSVPNMLDEDRQQPQLGHLNHLGNFEHLRDNRDRIEPFLEYKSDKAKSEKNIPLINSTKEFKVLREFPDFKEPKKLKEFNVKPGLPSIELLDIPEFSTEKQYSAQGLELLSREVELRLKDFGVIVQVVAAHPGPVVTRFEMQLAAGIKVSKITSLAKDLARSLSVISVRVVEVIPGKSVVGLELPNPHREIVRLSEVLNSPQYQEARSPLSLALGKDIAGHPVVVDLGKMPHLLVAGTTGAGKSVGLNAMLLSLLFKATPEEVQMIMIDPKMLELSVYADIPHLLTPVVTDMKEAANALRWCVGEMEKRYRLMSALGVRNLAGYNIKVEQAREKGEPILDPFWRPAILMEGESAPELQKLPYIVVVIDEFADMIMVVGKKVEELIARIAQKARAAGIHLILATQRPSVDVITGLIKANIPTRIAFQVSSKVDSRTILDQQGAEQLLGHGDMLYLAPGTGVPIRVHGAFVADHEVHAVVEDWKGRGSPQYIDDICDEKNIANIPGLSGLDMEGESGFDAESDALYDEAVKIVLETRRASISSVQRRLRIGYNRAARLLEAMEAAGLVTAMESNGSREVLVPERQQT